MSTEEELVSLPNLKDAIKCPKCQSPLSDPVYIEGHDVFHCVCHCGYEWVE